MNIMKILSIEVNGITDAINEYTSEPLISNITNNLKRSIECEDVEETLYLLKKFKNGIKRTK